MSVAEEAELWLDYEVDYTIWIRILDSKFRQTGLGSVNRIVNRIGLNSRFRGIGSLNPILNWITKWRGVTIINYPPVQVQYLYLGSNSTLW